MSIRLRSAGEDEMVAEIMIDNIYEWKDYKCASYLKYPWTGRITNDLKKIKKNRSGNISIHAWIYALMHKLETPLPRVSVSITNPQLFVNMLQFNNNLRV